MALDKGYFDDISIEIVKKKYYNANKVDRLLADIRRQALALTEDNRQLRAQLDALSGQKDEIGDTLLSAKTIARQMVEDASRKARETETEAEAQAERKLREAEEQAQRLLADAEARRSALEESARRDRQRAQQAVERLCGAVKELLLGGAEQVDSEWQDFLGTLEDEDMRALPAEPAEVPADLDEKVSAIAQLLELDAEDEGDGAETDTL